MLGGDFSRQKSRLRDQKSGQKTWHVVTNEYSLPLTTPLVLRKQLWYIYADVNLELFKPVFL